MEYLEDEVEEEEEKEEPAEEQFMLEVEEVVPVKKSPVKATTRSIKVLNKIPTTTPPRQPPAVVKKPGTPQQKLLNSFKLNKVYKDEFLNNPAVHQNEDGNMEIVTEEPDFDVGVFVKPEEKSQKTVKTENPNNVFACEQCERSFALKQQLIIHQQNHVRERNFPCDVCDRAFFSKYGKINLNLFSVHF